MSFFSLLYFLNLLYYYFTHILMSFRKTMMKFILESKKSAGPSVNQRSKDSILVPDDVVTAIKKIVVKHPTGLSDSLLSTDFIVS